MPVCGARIKPNVQGVADLVVVCSFVTEQFGDIQLEPSLNALLLNTLRHLLHQLGGAWVQLAAFFVQEERNRHTPVALTRDAPVWPPSNHAVQARLPPGRDKGGFFDRRQRPLTQSGALLGLRVHADEPLRSSAVDQRRFVPPTVHVAVLNHRVFEQATDFIKLGDDIRVGLPNKLTAEERQRLNIHAIALHWTDDVVVAHAVAFAGTEVLLAIGWG